MPSSSVERPSVQDDGDGAGDDVTAGEIGNVVSGTDTLVIGVDVMKGREIVFVLFGGTSVGATVNVSRIVE